MAGVLFSSFARHPYWGLMWAGCQLISRTAYLINYRTDLLEEGFYKTWVFDNNGILPPNTLKPAIAAPGKTGQAARK